MRPLALSIALLAGCSHTDAFVGADPPLADEPFAAGSPTRLTYDPGMDLFPSWRHDGESLVYSYQPPERDDHDRCIAVMLASAGTRREVCYAAVDGATRTDALEWPALDQAGNLIFTHYISAIGDRIPDRGSLRIGTLDAPFDGRVLLTLPNGVGATGFTRIGQTEWSGADEFLFVAQDYLMLGNLANGNKKDTTYIGLGIIRGTLSSSGVSFAAVAGTDSATGFTRSAAGDTIYFSRYQDTRLYAVPATGGARQVVFTAATSGDGWVLRDPTRIGTRVAVVVARLDQLAQPRGLLPGTRVEAVRPGFPGAEPIFEPPVGGGIGHISASASRCRLVVESRRPSALSWTTDLEARCAVGGPTCAC